MNELKVPGGAVCLPLAPLASRDRGDLHQAQVELGLIHQGCACWPLIPT